MAFNKVIIMGRLTSDPESKQTQSGVSVTSFTLAVDRRYNNGEEKKADFITVVAWKQTADFICRYFKKGQAMLVCGELQTRSWQDNNGGKRYATEVVASEVSFCESKRDVEANTSANQNAAQGANFGSQGYIPDAYKQAKFDDIKDEGLPF